MILAQDFLSSIRKYIENVRIGAYIGWARALSYAQAWDRSTVHKTDTPVRFGNIGGGGSVLGTSTGFASDVIKHISEAVRYSQEHNNTQ